MAGTVLGGKKCATTNKARQGDDFYKRIGALGGKKTMAEGAKPKGFALGKTYSLDDPRHPSNAGRIGGKLSRRNRK